MNAVVGTRGGALFNRKHVFYHNVEQLNSVVEE